MPDHGRTTTSSIRRLRHAHGCHPLPQTPDPLLHAAADPSTIRIMKIIGPTTTSLTLGYPNSIAPSSLTAYIGQVVYSNPTVAPDHRDCRRHTEEVILPLTATHDPATRQITLTDFDHSKLAPGVWLIIVQTDCGCYSTRLFYDCDRTDDTKPHLIPTHQPTSPPIPTPVCAPTP